MGNLDIYYGIFVICKILPGFVEPQRLSHALSSLSKDERVDERCKGSTMQRGMTRIHKSNSQFPKPQSKVPSRSKQG